MGLFGNISQQVEDIETDPNVAPGTHKFEVTDVAVKTYGEDSKMPGQSALLIKLTVIDSDDDNQIGKEFTDFLRIPDEELQEKWKTFASIMKSHLLWYGIPESVMADFDPEDEEHKDSLIGTIGTGTIRKNGTFVNLVSFEVEEESGVSTLSAEPEVSGKW